jgi:tight adherence protein B
MTGLIAAFLLLGAVAVVLGPRRAARARLVGRRRAPARFKFPDVRPTSARLQSAPPWRVAVTAAAPPSVVILLVAGPVAATIVAVYAALAATAWQRRARQKQAAATRSADLEAVSALVADLRAGLPPVAAGGLPPVAAGGLPPVAAGASALGGPAGSFPATGRIRQLAGAVSRLAEQTGAPAADLLDRIAADARSADQATAKAVATAAGAQATALLLAGLPLGGIGLGYAIGANPLTVLLHTPAGAACALLAALLQAAGLAWAQRLVDGPR